MLRLKDTSVDPSGTKPQIWFGLGVATALYARVGHDCVVTSLTDGEHNPGSLHPLGLAADVRVKQIVDSEGRLNGPVVESLFDQLKGLLHPQGFDVVWEGGVGATPMTTGAHIHIEYQPHTGGRLDCGQ